MPDQCGPGRRDAGPGRVQLAAHGAETGAEVIPVLLQPLLRTELRRPPGELQLIQLTLGFRKATPELAYVAFQPVALLGQLTEATVSPPVTAGSSGGSPGSGVRWTMRLPSRPNRGIGPF